MPADLRFVLLLVVAALIGALVAVPVIHEQDVHRARINAEQMTGGRVDRGRIAIARYGCGACHVITGINEADGLVGPSLSDVASRAEIAGRLPNQPPAMIEWLQHPQNVVPDNGMPDQGVSDTDARDIAAYLYTLRHSD